MLQKQKFFFILFVIDLQRLRDIRGCGNLAFSAWKNGHVDFPHTFDATPGLSAGSVLVSTKRGVSYNHEILNFHGVLRDVQFFQGTRGSLWETARSWKQQHMAKNTSRRVFLGGLPQTTVQVGCFRGKFSPKVSVLVGNGLLGLTLSRILPRGSHS